MAEILPPTLQPALPEACGPIASMLPTAIVPLGPGIEEMSRERIGAALSLSSAKAAWPDPIAKTE